MQRSPQARWQLSAVLRLRGADLGAARRENSAFFAGQAKIALFREAGWLTPRFPACLG